MLRLIILFFFLTNQALALSPEQHLPDQAQEARAMKLFSEIKCLVCEGQSVEGSSTEFSYEMRKLIRAKISAGKSDDEVRAELVREFGDSVLLSSEKNIVLWVLPFLFMVIIIFYCRGRPLCRTAPKPRMN